MSSLTQITWIDVDQKLRGNKGPGCKQYYLQTQCWMSIMSIRFIAYNWWRCEGCFDVINVSVDRASTIFSLTHSAINRLHCHILPKWMHWSVLLRKRQMTRSLPHPKNELQWSVNDFWPCILQNPKGCAATLTHKWTIGHLSRQKWLHQQCYYVLKSSVNRVSTTYGLASRKIQELCGDINQ